MITRSAAATIDWGRTWARCLPPTAIVALYGDLASGKTTLVKGIVEQLTGVPAHQVQSPTFTLLNIYEADTLLYHFDLYRLNGAGEFIEGGFLDYLEGSGICLIEWPERVADLLPAKSYRINLSHIGGGRRKIDVQTG